MEFFEKLVLGGVGAALVAFLLERARVALKQRDGRQNEADERRRKGDAFDTLLSSAKRWKRRAALCADLHDKKDPALGYALRDLNNEIDLTEWEKIKRPQCEAPTDSRKDT